MTISRRLTMKHVKLLLTSGTVPLLGRGLGPGDVTLQINGVVLADNMKVADLCNAADIAVVTMPLGLTFGGDGKKATTLAKKAREALALVGLTVADVLFYARDGGEAAYLGLLKPEECMDVRFESYMLAAAYIWANKGLLMVAIVLSLGLGEDASTSTRDLLLKLRALRDEGASRCYYLLSKPEFLLHTSVLAALNYAVVHASLKWGHTYRGFRFNELGTHVMNLVAKYVAVAIDPKASGLFDDAYAYAKPLGFEHAVDNLAKNYTGSSTGGIVAGGELPSILYEALAKKFCSYKVDNAHSEVMVKILKWVIAEGHTLPGHRGGNTASENDSVPDGLVKGEFKQPRWGKFSALKKPDGAPVVKGVDCFEALERCADVILYDLAPLAKEEILLKLEELRRDGAPNWDRVATTGLLKNLRAAFDGFRKLEVRDGEALLQRLRQLDADAHELSQARQRVHAARRHLSNPDLVLGSLEDGQTLIAYVRRLSNLPELDAAALPNNARPLRDVLDAVRRIVEAKMRYSALSKGDAIQAKILAKNGEDYCAGVVNSMSGSRSGTVNEEALVHRLELMCYKKILSGDLGRTGKSVVMTISRRLTMKHVKLLLTSGTVPLLGRGLGPGDVTLQINGVVLADNMKVADLCNAVTLHAYIAREGRGAAAPAGSSHGWTRPTSPS
ncbi:hypothetical protein JL720_12076 [Aureococcus anophagefferens]|nr:hypothetical protein JL720_12076 [Aureococcus anophagefferens]